MGLPELQSLCAKEMEVWGDSPGQFGAIREGHTSPAQAQQRHWNWVLEKNLCSRACEQRRYPAGVNHPWGAQGSVEEPWFSLLYWWSSNRIHVREQENQCSLTNFPFREIIAKIIQLKTTPFWWSKGYLSRNNRYASKTPQMKDTASMSFGSAHSVSSLLSEAACWLFMSFL